MTWNRKRFWRYARALAAPVLLWCLVVATLKEPVEYWLRGEERFDEDAIREWIKEARVFRETLPEMASSYVQRVRAYQELASRSQQPDNARQTELRDREVAILIKREEVLIKREEIGEHLKALGNPPTKMYTGQLPLFPIIYHLEVRFTFGDDVPDEMRQPIAWESELPREKVQFPRLENYPIHGQATLNVEYQLHAYNKQQRNEQITRQRLRLLILLAVAASALAVWWIYLVQHRERERERQRVETKNRIDEAEHQRLEEEVRRQEAERLHEEAERRLLEQQLATQAAERQALELKSQLYASIGIMAGSYAHNIKNLLVRPNDLLSRCLEADGLPAVQQQMLKEVRQTLGTVTERLQQILRTVHRDPSRSEMTRLDLNAVVRDLCATWRDLALGKWKLTLTCEVEDEPVWIEGDLSHLQQAIENLIFNSRDATFEMRNNLRDQAHRSGDLDAQQRRQALIAAAAWRGEVLVRVRRAGERSVLEVSDNGIGMSEDVRRRCTEAHFSTKRDNAVYEGISTGMGLGLSFVVVILEHHHADVEILSAPLKGTTMRVTFPNAN